MFRNAYQEFLIQRRRHSTRSIQRETFNVEDIQRRRHSTSKTFNTQYST